MNTYTHQFMLHVPIRCYFHNYTRKGAQIDTSPYFNGLSWINDPTLCTKRSPKDFLRVSFIWVLRDPFCDRRGLTNFTTENRMKQSTAYEMVLVHTWEGIMYGFLAYNFVTGLGVTVTVLLNFLSINWCQFCVFNLGKLQCTVQLLHTKNAS